MRRETVLTPGRTDMDATVEQPVVPQAPAHGPFTYRAAMLRALDVHNATVGAPVPPPVRRD